MKLKITRRRFITTSLAVAGGAFVYARWIEPRHLTVTRRTITLPRLPSALDGIVIAQLTDLHHQPDVHDALMAEAIDLVNRENPHIIALTGDYITKETNVFSPLMAHLQNLRAQHAIYAVAGNHDRWHGDLTTFQSSFRQAGFDFLLNQGSLLEILGEKLFIAGTDSVWGGSADPSATMQGHREEPVIALVHEPDYFDTMQANHRLDLQLSGHTHGGQCRVPLIGYAPVGVRYGRKYVYGEFQQNNSRLFVSRGLGTVGYPVRFACAPEVAFLTLRSGKAEI
ncbi:MAG: metallophosphoesterase [Akkermansiaceae bacterium]